MARRAIKRTDIGTIVLHWLLVGALLVDVLTGLRVMSNRPGYEWIQALDPILSGHVTWSWHVLAGLVIFSVSLAYIGYVSQSGLARRIWPDKARLMGLFGRPAVQLSAINIILYWLLFGMISLLLFTGIMMYLGHGGLLVQLHRFATWAVLGFPVAHVLVHFCIGGLPQLLRVFRPMPLAPSPPPFDPFDILALPPGEVSSQIVRGQNSGARRPAGSPRTKAPINVEDQWKRTDTMLQANPVMVAIAAGFSGIVFLYTADEYSRDTLHIPRLKQTNAPMLDGDIADSVWRTTKPVIVETAQGHNFDGRGATSIQVRAVHDGKMVYFSFIWDDPTRSLKHLPLYKKEDGWYVIHEGFEREDENSYNNDGFAMALTTIDRPDIRYSGGHTFFVGVKPLPDKPASFAGRGLHYTNSPKINDVWYWKASQGGMLGWCDDAEIGMPKDPSPEQAEGKSRYSAGLAYDPGTGMAELNFEQRPPSVGYGRPIQPKRLPTDPRRSWKAMGNVNANPELSESDGSIWWLTEADSVPYTAERDAQIPVGAVIPGVVITGEPSGDRASLRCAARWAAGRWTLEARRELNTGSEHDVIISNLTAFRLAAFDHTQIAHTRQIRVIQIELE